MRLLNSPSGTPTILLVMLGAVFALGNLWCAAARSMIPVALAGRVTDKIRLAEKHPGVDDVYLLELDDRRRIQVDRSIFAAVNVNSSVTKSAWSRKLRIGQRDVEVTFSSDVYGMLVVMPALWLTCVYLACGAAGRSRKVDELSVE